MIGRVDCILVGPPIENLSDLIIGVCRRWWPDGVFVDGNETRVFRLNSRELAWRGPSSEFFVFRDVLTESVWDELGPCESTWNLMLHFLCRRQIGPRASDSNVTVIVDEVTPTIRRLLDDLQAAFSDAYYFAEAA